MLESEDEAPPEEHEKSVAVRMIRRTKVVDMNVYAMILNGFLTC